MNRLNIDILQREHKSNSLSKQSRNQTERNLFLSTTKPLSLRQQLLANLKREILLSKKIKKARNTAIQQYDSYEINNYNRFFFGRVPPAIIIFAS